MNVALPDIARQLHTALDTAQWILSGYLLALAAGLAASAYLAKRFGTRRVYLASLLGFTLASVLCALAPSIGVLIAARALQGALGAALVPLAMRMLLGKAGAGRQMPPAAGILLSVPRETVEKGTWNDASVDRGRGNGRAHLPGPRRRPVAARASRRA